MSARTGWSRSSGARAAGWTVAGVTGLFLVLLLTAVIGGPAAGADCAGEGLETGDVTAVGDYTEPLRFGPITLLPAQLTFADVVAKRTHWDLWVIRAQVYNEMNGAAAARRLNEHNNNWLNVGYRDELHGRGDYDSAAVWRDPIRAGNATADWIQGRRRTLGQRGSDSIRRAYEQGATETPERAIELLQRSGWASSGYPNLPAIYRRMVAAGRGLRAPTPTMTSAAVAAASCAPESVLAGGVASAGAIARRYLGATSPAQMPGFTGAFPRGQWCAWFVTNVLRKAGVDMPVMPFSGSPYLWAKQHPGVWDVFKAIGHPARAAVPPIGSLLMYGSAPLPGQSAHVNMVERTFPDGSFDLIGGNQGSGCPTGSCVSEHKACRLVGWRRPDPSHLDCGDPRPIYGIVTPRGPGLQA